MVYFSREKVHICQQFLKMLEIGGVGGMEKAKNIYSRSFKWNHFFFFIRMAVYYMDLIGEDN